MKIFFGLLFFSVLASSLFVSASPSQCVSEVKTCSSDFDKAMGTTSVEDFQEVSNRFNCQGNLKTCLKEIQYFSVQVFPAQLSEGEFKTGKAFEIIVVDNYPDIKKNAVLTVTKKATTLNGVVDSVHFSTTLKSPNEKVVWKDALRTLSYNGPEDDVLPGTYSISISSNMPMLKADGSPSNERTFSTTQTLENAITITLSNPTTSPSFEDAAKLQRSLLFDLPIFKKLFNVYALERSKNENKQASDFLSYVYFNEVLDKKRKEYIDFNLVKKYFTQAARLQSIQVKNAYPSLEECRNDVVKTRLKETCLEENEKYLEDVEKYRAESLAKLKPGEKQKIFEFLKLQSQELCAKDEQFALDYCTAAFAVKRLTKEEKCAQKFLECDLSLNSARQSQAYLTEENKKARNLAEVKLFEEENAEWFKVSADELNCLKGLYSCSSSKENKKKLDLAVWRRKIQENLVKISGVLYSTASTEQLQNSKFVSELLGAEDKKLFENIELEKGYSSDVLVLKRLFKQSSALLKSITDDKTDFEAILQEKLGRARKLMDLAGKRNSNDELTYLEALATSTEAVAGDKKIFKPKLKKAIASVDVLIKKYSVPVNEKIQSEKPVSPTKVGVSPSPAQHEKTPTGLKEENEKVPENKKIDVPLKNPKEKLKQIEEIGSGNFEEIDVAFSKLKVPKRFAWVLRFVYAG